MLVGWVLWAAGCTVSAEDGGLRLEGGNVEHEAREGAAFDQIRVADNLDVEVEVGEPLAVMAVAEASMLPRIRTSVANGQLDVGVEGTRRASGRVEIDAPSMRVIQLEGSGDADIELLTGSRCVISTAGSGDVVIDRIACDALSVKGSGSGDVEIAEGTVGALDIDLKGSGNAELSEVVAQHVRASTVGSGDITVRAEGGIDATSTGSGDIQWTGGAEARVVARGSGDVGHR